MGRGYFLTENRAFFLYSGLCIIVILIWNADTLTKKIHLPTLANRLTASLLCCAGQLLHLSPLFPTRAFYVFHEKVSIMTRPPPIKL